jgi:PAS domain S-box-containing protein
MLVNFVLKHMQKDKEYVAVVLTFKDGRIHTVQQELQIDEGTRYAQITASPLKNSTGNIIAGIEVVRDITELKKAEIALQYSEEKYRTTVDFLDYALHVADDNLNILLINNKLLEWNKSFGLDTDVIGKNVFEVYPFLSSKVQEEYKSIFKTGNSSKTEESTFFNEREVITETKKIPIFEQSKVIKVITIMRDITERKQATKSLKVSEAKFRSLSEGSPNMIFINYKGRVVYANKKCEEIMGYTKDEFYSERFDFRSLIAPEYLDLVSSSFQKHMQGEEVSPYEYAVLTKNGKRLEVIITTNLIEYENNKAILGIITDITERKKTEEEMKRSKVELRERIGELEEFYKMAVGRELRMKQLKEENEELKEALKKYENP